jgi:hypothetical protein
METNKELFDKLNDHFKDNIRMKLINYETVIIITKEDLFYCIDINNEKIPYFIINDENSVIESMIIKDLCYKHRHSNYLRNRGFNYLSIYLRKKF